MRRTYRMVALALVIGVLLPGPALGVAGGSDLPVRGWHAGSCTLSLETGQGHCLTTGWTTHFGTTTVAQDLQAVPSGPGTMNLSGTWTVTTANGDEIFGTVSGVSTTADGINFTLVGYYVSTGGTGRLADASMTLDATGEATLVSVDGAIATQVVEAVEIGRLSY